MTKLEFPGSALTTDQWAQVSRLATSLSQEQAIWISGYFAGLSHQGAPPQPCRTSRSLRLLFRTAPPRRQRRGS